MSLDELCKGMPRLDADEDLKRRGAEVDAGCGGFWRWGRSLLMLVFCNASRSRRNLSRVSR